MGSLQCHKTTEKGLGQGYYGGGSGWGSQSNQCQNGYSMSYSEHERHAQIRCPTYGVSESHTAYGYGKFHGTHGNAMSKPQTHGHHHQTSPGKHHGPGYGYGHDGTNGHGKFNNHGMQHSPPQHGGKLSGNGNGYRKPQTYGHGGNMTYGMTETETCSGGRGRLVGKGTQAVKGLLGKIKNGLSGNNSSSDSESDSDEEGHRKRTVCVSKAL